MGFKFQSSWSIQLVFLNINIYNTLYTLNFKFDFLKDKLFEWHFHMHGTMTRSSILSRTDPSGKHFHGGTWESEQRSITCFSSYIAIVLDTRAACQRSSDDMFLLYCSVYYMGFDVDILSLWTMKVLGTFLFMKTQFLACMSLGFKWKMR